MGKRIDYRFRALVGEDSLEAMLVDYFRSKDADLDEKDMVMWANCACWIPLAQKKRQEQGICSEAEFKQSGRLSIYKLLQHIYLLAHICGLEEELEVVPALRPQGKQSSNKSDSFSPITRECTTSQQFNSSDSDSPSENIVTAIPQNSDLLYHEDDATFQSIFSQ